MSATKRFWPVPQSYSTQIPILGPGSFGEDRGDRRHCGVDIYAPSGSDIFCIEKGAVIEVGVMTDPEVRSYWNKTFFVAIKHGDNLIAKYCEMADVVVDVGDLIDARQLIGHVGTVLNFDAINERSPQYIQKVKESGNASMLHFELYKDNIFVADYLGGNWFSKDKPSNLLDPTDYLASIQNYLQQS